MNYAAKTDTKSRIFQSKGCVVKVIYCPAKARRFISSLSQQEAVALDFETTSLTPDEGEVRLSCFSVKNNQAVILDHLYCGSFRSYAEDIVYQASHLPFYVFNIGFEGEWLERCSGVTPLLHHLLDVGHMRRACLGGGPLNLRTQAKLDLGIPLKKDLQLSDWTDPDLTAEQYFYGGYDAIVTRKLGLHWEEELDNPDYDRRTGFKLFNNCWRAVNECQETGIFLDVTYHQKLIKMWTKRQEAAYAAIRKLLPKEYVHNINSKKQLSDFFKEILDDASIRVWPKTGKKQDLKLDRDTLRSMSYAAPYPFSRLLAALMVYNRASKYISTYGETLITKQMLSADNRLHFRLNVAQAITGRFSSSGPNLQNIPRSPLVRRSFIAPRGFSFIIADYKGIEIRVLAELADDERLRYDCIYGDVHTESTIAIYDIKNREAFIEKLKAKDATAKEMRARAKSFTFQLLYGAGAAALSIVLRCSIGEAEEFIARWAKLYPKAYAYRTYMMEKMRFNGMLPCQSGRTIYVKKQDRTMPVAANYPVQGSAGDVMYAALIETHRILEEEKINAWMVLTVHDELLLLAEDNEEDEEQAKEALERGMTRAWELVFPDTILDNMVDAVVAKSWAEKA